MPESKSIWKALVFTGLALSLLAASAFTLEIFDTLPGGFAAYDSTALTGLIGFAVLLIGLIGWATQLGRAARARLAALVLAPPVLVAAFAFLGHPNVHGMFVLFFLASIPLIPVAIILGMMAARARRP